MKSAYQIIRRPVITEKGLAIKENQNTLVFQVAPQRPRRKLRKRCKRFSKSKCIPCAPRRIREKNGGGGSLPAIVPTGRRHMCG